MTKRFLLLFSFIACCSFDLFAQPPGVYSPGGSNVIYGNGKFTKYVAGICFNQFDTALIIFNQANWGGYVSSNPSSDFRNVFNVNESGLDYLIWSGYTTYFDTIFPTPSIAAIIMKTTLQGDTIWSHIYDDYSGLYGGVMTVANDSNYLFGLYGGKGNVAKINRITGDTIWTNKNVYNFGGVNIRTSIQGMAVNNDSAYYFGGSVYPISNANLMLMKTDTLGNALWVKAYGDTASNIGWGGVQCYDGGFALVGQTAPNDFNIDTLWYHDFLVVRTDLNGDTLWCKRYDNNFQVDKAYSIVETSDHGFAVLGTTQSWIPLPAGNGADVHFYTLLLRLDSLGTPMWAMTYDPGFINQAYYSWELHQTSSNGFYWSDVLVQVTDSLGINCMAQPTTVTVGQPIINITPVNTYIEKGLDFSYRVYPHTLNPVGNNEIDYCQYLGINNQYITEFSLKIYPNPGHGDYQIEMNSTTSENADILLYDVIGQRVGHYQWQLIDGLNRKNLTLHSFKQGLYFIVIYKGDIVYNEKIIIE